MTQLNTDHLWKSQNNELEGEHYDIKLLFVAQFRLSDYDFNPNIWHTSHFF